MVTFSEIDTEITSRISPYTYNNNNNNNNDDTRGDRPLQGLSISTMELEPRTKKPCTSKPKDVTLYTPYIIPDGLRALTNGSDGLKFRKDSNIVPAAKVIVSTRKKQKQHTDDSTRLKRLKKTSQDEDEEIERCRHMFQMLDTREIGEVATTTAQFFKSGINKKGWIVPQTKALALPPHRPHQQGIQKKCNFCKSKLQIKRFKKPISSQEASSMSKGHGEYRMKVQSKVQELEVRLVKTQDQNEWFRARNEWLEERLRQVEIQQAEQRFMIQGLVEEKRFMKIEENCPCSSTSTSTSASFLASPLSAARRSNSPHHHHHLLHRMTHQQTA